MPRVPVQQWVLSFPIPLRILFAAHPELLTPLLRIVHRVIARFLLKQADLKRAAAHTGAVTLIQRFGSAVNLNIHLHCLVRDGVYRRTEGEPIFEEARAPTRNELEDLLDKIIVRLLNVLTRSRAQCQAARCDRAGPGAQCQRAGGRTRARRAGARIAR